MSYMVGEPDKHEMAALALYRGYGCSSNQAELHYVKCHGISCLDCIDNPELYRACPVYGAFTAPDDGGTEPLAIIEPSAEEDVTPQRGGFSTHVAYW